MAVVEVVSDGKQYHLLEVDTSDEAKALSTQILRSTSYGKMADSQIKEIEEALLKKSLRWPRGLIKREFGAGDCKGISHPQTTASNKGMLETRTLKQWAARLYSWMSSA